MDWTGGVRRRYAAGRNNALVQKQKAHFAKVRGALQHTPSSRRSFQPDFMRVSEGKAHDLGAHRESSTRETHKRRQSISAHVNDTGYEERPRKDLHPDVYRGRKPHAYQQPPSYVSISSGSPASSTLSQAAHHDSGRSPPPRSNARPPSRMTEEEQLLLANRRRLLARTDWLGLAAARPVQIKFPFSREKDRIGKRRKVEKTGNRAKPAGRRLVTPLFEERLQQPDLFMSGALPADDIRIRIGTDALASQTQRSRRSHTPAQTSVRQSSVEFGPLSEESMLLGEDGDEIEAAQAVENRFAGQHGAAHVPTMLGVADCLITKAGDFTRPSPYLRSRSSSEAAEAHGRNLYGPDHIAVKPTKTEHSTQQHFEATSVYDYGDENIPPGPEADPRPENGSGMPTAGRQLSQPNDGQPNADANGRTRSSGLAADDRDENVDEDDDETWRQLMRIQQYTSSHASMAALRSSSQHNTTSGSSRRPLIDLDQEQDHGELPEISTPKGVGAEGGTGIGSFAFAGGTERPTSVHSPSASLKQILRLAEQPAKGHENTTYVDDDENALWRDFVIGSEDGSDAAQELGRQLTQHLDKDEEPRGTLVAPLFSVSGLGTSNKSTLGDTLFVSEGTPGPVRYVQRKRKAELKPDDFTRMPSSEALRKCDTEAGYDRDSIEDSEPPVVQRERPSNIHASTGAILNPKMFKTKPAPPPHGPARFVHPKLKRQQKIKRSVYDLVDSDGISLA